MAMAHVDTSPRSRLRLPKPLQQSNYAAYGRSVNNCPIPSPTLGFAADSLGAAASSPPPTPSAGRNAVFVYSGPAGTTMVYLESMLSQLVRQQPNHTLHYGMILDSHSLHPRERIRVDGETVDSSLFEECSRECLELLKQGRGGLHQSYGRNAQERLDMLLIEIAMKVFERRNVTTIAVSIPQPAVSAIELMGLLPSAYGSTSTTQDWANKGTRRFTEQIVMEAFKPSTVTCGFEPLPAYSEQLPDEWRRRLIYLMRQPIQIISSSQPKIVRLQLQSIARIFGIAVEFAPSLSVFPECTNIQMGIFGPSQHRFAKLALAMCQSWAYRTGIIKHPGASSDTRERMASPAHRSPGRGPASPRHTQHRQHQPPTPTSTLLQVPPRNPPSWMIHGLTEARCPGRFYSSAGGTRVLANWHYNWAEMPDDFARTGTWFNAVCQRSSSNSRILLIHLPESFIASVRYRGEADGKWQTSDYRELLRSLYMPMRNIAWSYCVFAADMLYESNIIDSNVPPALSQHVLRDYWAQISGLHADQIHIAPSLAGALRFISSKCPSQSAASPSRSQHSASSQSTSPPHSYQSTHAHVSPTLKASHSPLPSPASTSTASSRRPSVLASSLGLSGKSMGKNQTISIENLRSRRRKFSVALNIQANETSASLPARIRKQETEAAAPRADILVTGSKSFVQSTILVTHR
ncbi:hypothetical protein GQ54DRAFT_213467 [Martensiomyces pterosporus]|nr:hypothetical protein GQ54DRAFT_213467 [Martensiomyces pterosporus]